MITLLFLLSLSIVTQGLTAFHKDAAHAARNPSVTIHELHAFPTIPKRGRKLRSELAPLYPGYGTHYVYAYIGTPPQRQSLIIDTGSATTAFPCKGCNNCGTHTDPYFDIKNSSTANIPKCAPNPNCPVGQTYGEGSSWHGFKVTDKLWIGDSEIGLIPGAASLSTDFTFACQQTLTGLFRSQLADGVLGLANVPESLPIQLYSKNITTSRIFALCYRVGGGILTLGGFDPAVHHHHSVAIAKLDKRTNGGYGVLIQYLKVRDLKSKTDYNVTALPAQYLGSTGAIINSGSTNTYLPASIAKSFEPAFARATKGVVKWTTGSITLTDAQINALPEIVFGLSSADGKGIVEVSMPISNYLEALGDGKYSFRLFFTSQTGTILGANFLMGYNVMFDVAANRLGFAKSTCNYEEVAPVVTGPPTAAPTAKDGSTSKCDPKVLVPYTACSAYCTRNESAYRVQGSQDYMNECRDGNVIAKNCYENCSFHHIARGPIPCLDSPWSECTHGCIKSRLVVPVNEPTLDKHGKCNYRSQTATCYSGLCPRQDGDYILYIDMRVRIEPYRWSYVHTEYFYAALSSLLKIYIHNIEMLHGTGNEYAAASKLHFQIRLKAKDYANVLLLHDAAEKLIEKCRRSDFGSQLLASLIELSSWWEGEANNRFGWLFPTDIEVLSAVAIPIGDTRDPTGSEKHKKHHKSSADDDSVQPTINTFGYFLLGIAVAAIIIIIVLLFLHFRLREEYALLSKDKSSLSKSSHTLRKLWSKFANFAKRQFSGNHKNSGNPMDSSSHGFGEGEARVLELSRIRKEQEQALSRMGLMHGGGRIVGDEEDDEILSDDGN